MEGYHKSVLLKEAVAALQVKAGEWYLDLTLGDGGHTLEILKQRGCVIGIDVDPEAIIRTKERLGDLGFLEKVILIQGNFRDVKDLIAQSGIVPRFTQQQKDAYYQESADAELALAGAIFDLGVSSLQLETPGRGFSFTKAGPIDMRMDPNLGVKALDLLNTLSRKEFYELFSKLGEEKYSWCLAGALVRARGVKPFSNTAELAEVIAKKAGGVRGRVHPATRIFQALRIAVNDELEALREGLAATGDLIKKGRIVIISFHSLEDRIVKNTFKDWQEKGQGEIVTKKPAVPGDEEIAANARSRSAKMRVFQKI